MEEKQIDGYTESESKIICLESRIRELEAINAELLKTLKYALTEADTLSTIEIIEKAIAKAEAQSSNAKKVMEDVR